MIYTCVFLQILLQLSPNQEVKKLVRISPIRISSSHQLSETITSELLARLWCMSNYHKFEKASYNVGIGSFLRLHWISNEKFKIRGIPDFVHNRISGV
jgi:hypothetical protein